MKAKTIYWSLAFLFIFPAFLFFFDKALSIGLYFLLFLTAATFLVLFLAGMKDKTLFYLLCIFFLVHLAAVLFIYYTNFKPFGGGADYDLYHQTAVEISQRFQQGNFSLEGLDIRHSFPVLIGIVYFLTLPEMLIGQLFTVWLALASGILAYLIVSEISGSRVRAFWLGLVICFYPSYIYFGSVLLKDTVTVPLVLAGLLLSIKIFKDFSWQKFLSFFIILTAVINLRFYIGYALLYGFAISWFFIAKFELKKRIKYGIIVFLILGFSPLLAGDGYFGYNDIKSFLKPERITFYREITYNTPPASAHTPPASAHTPPASAETSEGEGSTFVIKTGFGQGPFKFLQNYFQSFIYGLLGPFPWQIRYKRQLIALIEIIPWYFLLSIIIFSLSNFIRKRGFLSFFRHYKHALPLFLFSLIGMAALSLYINNYGIIFRIRMPMLISLLCIISLAGAKTHSIKNKFKITFISPVFEMAGAEKNVINIVKHLDKNKYEAAVIAGRAQEELKNKLDNRSKLIILGNSNSIFLFFAVIRHLRREKPDILFSGLPHINLISTAAKIFSRSGAKLILVEHTNFLSLAGTAKTPGKRFLAHFILPFLIRFFYPKADAIICVSNGVAKDLLAVAPRLSKIEVIYNPVVDELMSKLALEQVQHPWFSNSKIPIIVSVGRLVKAKDYPNLLKAFKIVLSSLNCRLVVIGQGEQKSFLEELGRRLGVGDKVAFLGFQENPYKYMARASVFVLSSAREGFGNAIVEAMALGLPVVATSSAGPSEIIENNKNGLLVPVGNEKSLAAAIFKILRDPILAGKFAEQGKKRAQDFTIEKSVQKYEEVFKKLIQCKPAS